MAKLEDRYANALLKLSEERNSLKEDLEQVTFVRDVLKRDDVQVFLLHPHVPNSAKNELFQKLFSNNLAKHLMGFLNLMVRKGREPLIEPALTQYIDRSNRRLGRVEAKIVSAKKLTEKQIESIRIILSKKLDMEIKIRSIVDPDVIGGFYILVDGHIYDRTVRSELNIMRERLKRGS